MSLKAIVVVTFCCVIAASSHLCMAGDIGPDNFIISGSLQYEYSNSRYSPTREVATRSSESLSKESISLGALYEPSNRFELRSVLSYYNQRSHYEKPGVYGQFWGTDPIHFTSKNEALAIDSLYALLRDSTDRFSVGIGRNPNGVAIAHRNSYASFSKPTDSSSTLTSYDFDGITLTYNPILLSSTKGYVQFSYGEGFENRKLTYHYDISGVSLSPDTFNSQSLYGTTPLYKAKVLSASVIPINTSDLKLWFSYVDARNIYSVPTNDHFYTAFTYTDLSNATQTALFDLLAPVNLGNMRWYSIGVDSHKDLFNGKLHGSIEIAQSKAEQSISALFTSPVKISLINLNDTPSKTGRAIYGNIDFELPSKTTLGFEYSYGSKYWVPTVAGKYGTRGLMIEPYVQQKLMLNKLKCSARLGLQHFEYKYSGSNQWWGEPISINDVGIAHATATDTFGYDFSSFPSHSNTIYGNIIINF